MLQNLPTVKRQEFCKWYWRCQNRIWFLGIHWAFAESLKTTAYVCFSFPGFQCTSLYIVSKCLTLVNRAPASVATIPSLSKHQPCWFPLWCFSIPKLSSSSRLWNILLLLNGKHGASTLLLSGRRDSFPFSKLQLEYYSSRTHWLSTSDPYPFSSQKL